MGIKKFHVWLKDKYPQCYVKDNKHRRNYNHVYIDLNYILHQSLYNNKKMNLEFVTNVYFLLDHIICKHLPTKSLTIAIDGASPYAKIKLQQKRRKNNGTDNSSDFSSSHLTPGTIFMNELTKHMKVYVETRKNWFRYLDIKFLLFPASQPDEGELKILHQLIVNGTDNMDTHLVIGNDADLIVMCMSLKNICNIDILVKTNKKIGYEVISINTLIKEIGKDYFNLNNLSMNTLKLLPYRQDFCILSILMGNDYLPKLHSVKLDSLWKSYKLTLESLNTNLIKDINFNIPFFKKFMENIILHIAPQFRKFNKNSYKKNNIKNYLIGLLWCLEMYTTGECKMYDFEFNNISVPHPTHILHYLETEDYDLKPPSSTIKPLNAETCGILLLAQRERHLLPKKYHNLIETKLDKFYQIENCEQCNKNRQLLRELHRKIYFLDKEDEERQDACDEISDLYNENRLHVNKTHHDIPSIAEVRNIIESEKID